MLAMQCVTSITTTPAHLLQQSVEGQPVRTAEDVEREAAVMVMHALVCALSCSGSCAACISCIDIVCRGRTCRGRTWGDGEMRVA